MKIAFITKTASVLTLLATLVCLVFPGWRFSVGVLVGGVFSVLDFMMIVKTVKMLKLSLEDSKIMLKFGLVFVGKSFVLLLSLALIVLVFRYFHAMKSLYGFLCGLLCVPISIFISAFAKNKE